MDKKKRFTTGYGIPVHDDQASVTTGKKEGYTMMSDVHLVEKLAHFNRERIPERVVHAKGAGAGGYFEVTNDLSKYTRADFLSEVGKRTELFARFSTVGGEKGSADSARDPRGFAVKFYTEEGNYDLVGNNTPIFFIRDAIKFPDFIHTQKRNPQTNLPDPDMFWDFLSLTPESIHQVTILFSDRGTPENFRHMNGYSSHTYMWYSKENEYVWVKYHFKTDQGNKTLTAEQADELASKDPDHATRDLFESIKEEKFPSWSVYVQIMTPEEAKEYKFDPFDVTKVWYQSDFPLIPLGKMVLNRNPDNYFAEVEQSAFAPSSLVPGISSSPDKLLQGRLFAYEDAHRYRLGANHHQIEVNSPKHATANTYQRDGAMNVDGNSGNAPNYYPNSMGGVEPDPSFAPPAIEVQAIIDRHTRPTEDVDFIQAGQLYSRVMNDEQRNHLISNIAGHLVNAKENIQYRQTALFYKSHIEYGSRVASKLGLDIDKVKALSKLSQEDRVKETK
ncbi:catalase [Alkalibaculum sp. M08DMB]|uniref:Catalase n=1 Tax=Alkalibaculum sporogenes TaxID=2655001 RepID=A0A6A7K8Y7_9FIRM|nr:catalase [Alkalibaculum sporogenes]MPW25657.1 catalase [Alkalibaculum sporogenes]